MANIDHQFEAMSTGMVLDKAFRLYTQNFPLMFGITAILNLPMLLVSVVPPYLTSSARNSTMAITAGLLAALVGLITYWIIFPLVTGAITKAVSDTYLGNPVTPGGALREAWRSAGTLVLTQLVAGVIVTLGLLLLIVPGVLWMLSYALIAPVVMVEASERRNRAEIRRRSWDLVSGNRGKVFVIIFIVFVMNLLLSSGSGWVTGLFFAGASNIHAVIQSILQNFISILVSPLQTIAITLLYYDFRIRKEGFDLEMLSQAIGSPTVGA
jgi:hypothetical protein